MQIFNKLKKCSSYPSPIAITIGNFDGLHLGHQAILHRMRQLANTSFVLTFSNHPATIVSKTTSFSFLITLSHRLQVIKKKFGSEIIVLPFTKKLSQVTAEQFLTQLKEYLPFNFLVLGHDAAFGHQRRGNPDLLYTLSKQLSFSLEYLEPIQIDKTIVSSSLIREFVQKGDLKQASLFLGRPYSILSFVQRGVGRGKDLGFPTANLSVQNLLLPPLGVYVVQINFENRNYFGIANLGRAPTLHINRSPMLEIHLFDIDINLYGKEIEVIFLSFLREERTFSSIQTLIDQIKKDIALAKTQLLLHQHH